MIFSNFAEVSAVARELANFEFAGEIFAAAAAAELIEKAEAEVELEAVDVIVSVE